jgi:hypothetical protein
MKKDSLLLQAVFLRLLAGRLTAAGLYGRKKKNANEVPL